MRESSVSYQGLCYQVLPSSNVADLNLKAKYRLWRSFGKFIIPFHGSLRVISICITSASIHEERINATSLNYRKCFINCFFFFSFCKDIAARPQISNFLLTSLASIQVTPTLGLNKLFSYHKSSAWTCSIVSTVRYGILYHKWCSAFVEQHVTYALSDIMFYSHIYQFFFFWLNIFCYVLFVFFFFMWTI